MMPGLFPPTQGLINTLTKKHTVSRICFSPTLNFINILGKILSINTENYQFFRFQEVVKYGHGKDCRAGWQILIIFATGTDRSAWQHRNGNPYPFYPDPDQRLFLHVRDSLGFCPQEQAELFSAAREQGCQNSPRSPGTSQQIALHRPDRDHPDRLTHGYL